MHGAPHGLAGGAKIVDAALQRVLGVGTRGLLAHPHEHLVALIHNVHAVALEVRAVRADASSHQLRLAVGGRQENLGLRNAALGGRRGNGGRHLEAGRRAKGLQERGGVMVALLHHVNSHGAGAFGLELVDVRRAGALLEHARLFAVELQRHSQKNM